MKLESLWSRILLRNGAWLIVPPLVISFGLWNALPVAYSPAIFWKDIPDWLGLLENIFRTMVFALPGILYFGKKEVGQTLGWYLYYGGLVAYLASYCLQLWLPASSWSQSLIGFTAPAWSTLFWLTGIGLVCKRTWLPLKWHRAFYLAGVFLFLSFHIAHTSLVYFRIM